MKSANRSADCWRREEEEEARRVEKEAERRQRRRDESEEGGGKGVCVHNCMNQAVQYVAIQLTRTKRHYRNGAVWIFIYLARTFLALQGFSMLSCSLIRSTQLD